MFLIDPTSYDILVLENINTFLLILKGKLCHGVSFFCVLNEEEKEKLFSWTCVNEP